MMELIKWLLFFLAIAKAEGLGSAWKFKEPSNSERIMQTILETCDRDEHSPNPVVIVGNYDKLVNKFISKSSFIRIDIGLNADEYKRTILPSIPRLTRRKSIFKASKIILIEDSPKEMSKYLQLLINTELWNHMAPLFIIGTQRSCKLAVSHLRAMWAIDILNAIYICRESVNNEVELFTINPITNYAPYPWKSNGTVKNVTVFRQIFDQNISCVNLNYDKTKFLAGFKIKFVVFGERFAGGRNEKNGIRRKPSILWSKRAHLQFIMEALNATGEFEVTTDVRSVFKRFSKRTSDIFGSLSSLDSYNHLSMPFFPHYFVVTIAVVNLKEEISTLSKILHIWSLQVLLLAAISLTILFLILVIKDHDFGLALLDLTRLLVYSSVLTNNRRHSFRIYFTTMLIFMIISNGVFQGLIAAFLTTEERGTAAGTIDELLKLGYKFKVPFQSVRPLKRHCPKCRIETVFYASCVDHVLNSTGYACILDRSIYETLYITLPLDYVKEPLCEESANYKSRLNWPLQNRVNDMIMKFVECGYIQWEKNTGSHRARLKRSSMEARWNSQEYRPVRLYKLTFAFNFLALGLSFATVVFIIELLWAKYGSRKTKKVVINHMGIST